MFRFLFGATVHNQDEHDGTMHWRKEEDFFAAELPACSRAVQARYADRTTPRPFKPVYDADGNIVNSPPRPGGHGYMLELAEWHGFGYDIHARFDELEAEYERFVRVGWQREGNYRMLFVATYLCPRWPRLRAVFKRWLEARVRYFQVVELMRHVAVLQTLLELERAQQRSGSGGGGKRKPPTLPPHVIASTAPTSLTLH